LNAFAAEAIGTFALVFFGCGAIAVGLDAIGVAAAFGLVIAAMVFTFGQTSGANFNPAVSVALAITGGIEGRRAVPYVAAQVGGAIAGAAALRLTLGSGVDLGVTQPAGPVAQSFVWEVGLTFFLMSVIAAATTDREVGRGVAAFAIGAMVALGSLVGGPISGASMNPARSIGPALVSGELEDLWIYLVAPVVGAIAASVTFARVVRPIRQSGDDVGLGPDPR
jgi:aquaporin NIP